MRRALPALLFGIGTAAGIWWISGVGRRARRTWPERGQVIYDNTPTASPGPPL